MRSLDDLIAELEEESSKHWYVAIVVGFENSTVFVSMHDADRMRLLNDAVNAGGQPVGLILVDKSMEESEEALRIMGKIHAKMDHVTGQCEGLVHRLTELAGHPLIAKFQNE